MSERSANLRLSFLDRLPWRRQKPETPEIHSNGHQPAHEPMQRIVRETMDGRPIIILHRGSLAPEETQIVLGSD